MATLTSPTHTYSTLLKWDSELNTGIVLSAQKPPLLFSPPVEFGGSDATWSPEHLLISSLASCYMTTFLHFAKLLKVTIISFHISAKTIFEKRENGYEATRFILCPKVDIQNHPGQHVLDNLFEKAKKYCFISNSVKGEVLVEPTIC